jgi:hypothetical protein
VPSASGISPGASPSSAIFSESKPSAFANSALAV